MKVIYSDIKINIKSINNKWWLDFYHNKKRIRKSTLLIANDKNLKEIKNTIIPEIITALIGNREVLYFKKDLQLNEFAVDFFKVYESTVRPHVFRSRLGHYNLKVNPFFGNTLIIDITPLQVEDWQNNLLKKYSVYSVVKYRSVFFSILEKALQNDLIRFNPLTRVKSPLLVNKKFKTLTDAEDDIINPFNAKEIKKILDNTSGNLYYAIFVLVHTGIRPGELISLLWSDIDFEKKRIAVDKTTFQGVVGDVKTQSSVRYVDLLPQVEVKLLELQKITGKYEHVFITYFKKPFYSADILNVRFKELLKEIDIKVRTIYNLRHTFASHMMSNIQNGVDILWISKQLGHKDLSITLKVYAKFIKEDDSIRFNKINKMGIILGIFNS